MLGSVLSRAVVGASPFIPTILASASLVIIHKIIARLSVSNQRISHMVKGNPLSIYKDGILNEKNLKKCSLSFGDVMEEVRLNANHNSLENIEEIFMERTGEISVIEKKGKSKIRIVLFCCFTVICPSPILKMPEKPVPTLLHHVCHLLIQDSRYLYPDHSLFVPVHQPMQAYHQ